MRQASRQLAQRLRDEGKSYPEIASEVRASHAVSARAAMRIAHQWTQQRAADEWTARWPDRPKEKKNFSYWERWPQGGRTPSLDDLARLAELYQCSLADLLTDIDFTQPAVAVVITTRPQAPRSRGLQDVSGWELVEAPDDASGADRLADSHSQAGPGDGAGAVERDASVAILRAARWRYERMYRQVGGVATGRRVTAFLDAHVPPLLGGQHGSDVVGSSGRLTALAGICAFDAGTPGIAQRYFQRALDLAHIAGDAQLAAYLSVLLANQMFLKSQYPQAIAIADSGLRKELTPALRTDLLLTQAKAYARTGARSDAYRAMTLAGHTAARIRPDEEPPEAGYVEPGLIELQMAEALAHLDDLAPAEECAEHAMRTPTHPRGRVQRLTTLARIDLRRGDIERAAASTLQMVDAAVGMESHQLRQRFRQVRNQLAAADSPVATEALDSLDSWLAVPL